MDDFTPGLDREGRAYNLQLVVVNFANVAPRLWCTEHSQFRRIKLVLRHAWPHL